MPHAKRTPATDIYALVATLYTLLTAEAPTAAALRDRIPLVSPRHLQPHLSAAVEHAVLQGIAMEPGDRSSPVEAWLKLLPQLEPVSASADPVNILSQAVTLVVAPRASGTTLTQTATLPWNGAQVPASFPARSQRCRHPSMWDLLAVVPLLAGYACPVAWHKPPVSSRPGCYF